MTRSFLTFLLAFAAMLAAPVHAQRPDLTRFRAFADPLVGRWSVTIRDLDETGRLTWEGQQQRVFAYILANEFLEERTVAPHPRGEGDVLVGLHLSSYDPAGNRLIQQGFWPGTPGLTFNSVASLSADNRRAEGAMEIPNAQGWRRNRRFEMLWVSRDEFAFRLYGRGTNGAEFLNEEFVYRRNG